MKTATKRPMSLSFSARGAGWAKARLHIGDDDFVFSISYIWGGINDFVKRVYYLSPKLGYDAYDSRVMEYEDAEIPSVLDGEDATRYWEDIPWRTTPLEWNSEPDFVRLVFERPINLDSDFGVSITLDVHRDENCQYSYTVRYRDLCYATAKAVTDLITECGIIGFYESTWMEDINLRQFLKIKEIALDMPIKKDRDSEDADAVHTSLEEEFKLLLKPM